jgi:choline dehydrogenase-like flavoprotein
MTDVIVVGSGPSAVNAAYPLVEAGKQVTILDVGNVDDVYGPLIPPKGFVEIRKSDHGQHRFFLGDEFEGVPFGEARVGAQLTPPRTHILRDAERLAPAETGDFCAMESFALGGLGAGWGAGAFAFGDDEFRGSLLTRAVLDPHYEIVAERTGITADRDDLLPFFGDLKAMLPPMEIDSNAETVLGRYLRRRKEFNSLGFYVGRTPLAVCTVEHRGRGPHGYHDMDFWADDRSVYRPRWTVEELSRYPSFRYVPRRFVLSFRETDSAGVEITARNVDSGSIEIYTASHVILAAGALGSARIVLRSLGLYETRVPILCNPYSYVPVVNLGMLGREARDRRSSLAQLTAIYEQPGPDGARVQAQYFSYRSLLTFKLLKEAPMPFREGIRMMRALIPLFGILGLNHADAPNPSRYCVLHRVGGDETDKLEIRGELTPEEERVQSRYDKIMLRFFRKLGCVPIKRIRLPQGSSIHYAGTIPMSAGTDGPSCDADCRLNGASRVYIADGSVLTYLPAKGLTFTTMALANRVGTTVLERL